MGWYAFLSSGGLRGLEGSRWQHLSLGPVRTYVTGRAGPPGGGKVKVMSRPWIFSHFPNGSSHIPEAGMQ